LVYNCKRVRRCSVTKTPAFFNCITVQLCFSIAARLPPRPHRARKNDGAGRSIDLRDAQRAAQRRPPFNKSIAAAWTAVDAPLS